MNATVIQKTTAFFLTAGFTVPDADISEDTAAVSLAGIR